MVQQGFDPNEAANRSALSGALVGVGNTALDVLPFGSFFLKRSPQTASRFLSNLARIGSNAGSEGTTEAAQEALQDAIQFGVEQDPDAFQEGARRYLEAAAVGGLLGAVATPAAQAIERLNQTTPEQRAQAVRQAFDDLRQQFDQAGVDPELGEEVLRNIQGSGRELVLLSD